VVYDLGGWLQANLHFGGLGGLFGVGPYCLIPHYSAQPLSIASWNHLTNGFLQLPPGGRAPTPLYKIQLEGISDKNTKCNV